MVRFASSLPRIPNVLSEYILRPFLLVRSDNIRLWNRALSPRGGNLRSVSGETSLPRKATVSICNFTVRNR